MIKRNIVLCFLVTLFTSCAKDGVYIPDVAVNYKVTIQEFKISAKNNVLLVKDQGVAGLLLVKTAFGYKAYDRCSSVNPEARCAVNVDEGGITATDPCTGAKFLLTDGSPAKSPAVRNLKAYQIRESFQELHITN